MFAAAHVWKKVPWSDVTKYECLNNVASILGNVKKN